MILTNLSKIFIGSITGVTLRVYDDNNYYELANSLGLDNEVIESPELKYRWICFHFKNCDYITSRTYFYHKAKSFDFHSGRTMKFLQLQSFGQNKALDWEEYMFNLETAQLDLFKVLDEQRKTNETNNEYLREWEDKNKKVREYQTNQKKLVL